MKAEGYNDGYEQGSIDAVENGADNGYEQGLNDAWECAREIGRQNQLMLEKMGFVIKEEYENGIRLDWNPSFYVINKYPASEAIAKIKEYEKKKTE